MSILDSPSASTLLQNKKIPLKINELKVPNLHDTNITNFFADLNNKILNIGKYPSETINNNTDCKSSEFIPTLIHQHTNKLLKQNSMSSPCLMRNSIGAINSAIINLSQPKEAEHENFTFTLPYSTEFKQNSMTKNSLTDLTQYINPDIHK